MTNDQNPSIFITSGYTRDRHWEVVYHDMVDLYGPKIGLDGLGLWVTYKRFIQHNPEHLLFDKTWVSHKGMLASLFGVGQNTLRSTRTKLKDAGLIAVATGRELVTRSRQQYEAQLLGGGKIPPNGPITMSRLAAMGIRNPATTLFIEVNDPLTLHAFCDRFKLTCSPYVKWPNGDTPVWEMQFGDDYAGIIRGPNRLLAAVRYVEDNLSASRGDRAHWPLVTEAQVRSLLRCKDDDRETIAIRNRLLQRRARLVGQSPGAPLPENVLTGLDQLGFRGSTAEVERHFRDDPRRVIEVLQHALRAAKTERDGELTVTNPAALFLTLLRDPTPSRHASVRG